MYIRITLTEGEKEVLSCPSCAQRLSPIINVMPLALEMNPHVMHPGCCPQEIGRRLIRRLSAIESTPSSKE
jgi:hypothetical protein